MDPPARGGVAHHPLNADPAVVFDGCASVHFSEREQYGYPPAGTPRRDECVSDEERNRDCGHPSTRDAQERACPVVGAAAADAVHMAFAPHDEWPDQAQFACSIRVRRAVVERDRRGDRPGNRARGEASDDRSLSRDDANDVFSAACWLEMTVDGATHALDMSQSRHVVVGPPVEWGHKRLDSPEPHPEPHPSESSRAERGPGGRIVTTRNGRDARKKSRRGDARERKRRRRGHDDPGNAGDDECSFSCGDVKDGDDDAGGAGDADPGPGPGPVALRRRYEKPPFGFGFSLGVGLGPSSCTKSAAMSDAPDEYDYENAPTPYVTIVFAHCSLNLYHHPGVLGCRRSSPAGERERVGKVRDALVAIRAAAELAGDALEAFRSNDLRSSLAFLQKRAKKKTRREHRDRRGDVHDTAQALLDDARVFAALARAADPETLFS